MSGTAERAVEDVTADLALLACAGIQTRHLRESTVKRVRELTDEGYRLVREDERRKNRKLLAVAWSAWLDLMMSVKLPEAGGKSLLQDVLDLEPELRERFEAAFLGDSR